MPMTNTQKTANTFFTRCLEEFCENDISAIRTEPTSPHQRQARSRLWAGASPENQTEDDQACANPCRRDDGPVDCKTLSVRRRLAEDLGCCGCTDKPETPCLVTEDTSACCVQCRPATPNSRRPEPDAAAVDPVDQIINEGLQQQPKKRHSRRRSSCSGSRPRRSGGLERHGGRLLAADHRGGGYQPDYFDDQADMKSWQEHRERSQRCDSRQRPLSPPPRPRSLAFEPYVDTEPYSPAPSLASAAAPQVTRPSQDENRDLRQQEMLLELERLDEQRAQLLQSIERERKVIEMVLEHKRQKRVCPGDAATAEPRDDRQRIQRRIDEARKKTAELRRRFQRPDGQQQCSPTRRRTPSPTGNPTTPRDETSVGAVAAETSTPCQRRRLRYQPPSPDTETEDECRAPPPRRRLLKYRPPSDSGSSSEDCGGNAADECGGRSHVAATAAEDRQSSLQDSLTYYNRSVRNGVPPLTANVSHQTSISSPWSNW